MPRNMKPIALIATPLLATLISVPLGLLLAATCFGLRRRDVWVLSETGLSNATTVIALAARNRKSKPRCPQRDW